MRTFLIATAILAVVPAYAQDDQGELAFNNHCRTCHSMAEGDNRMGPTLYGIDGKKAGASEGYNYSRSLASSDMIWDAETLDAFIADPDAVVPGNTMKPFSGLTNTGVRSKIVSYLTGGGAG